MPSIVSLFSSIPDVVWSGLIASGLTLSGVLLSNWSNTNRLILQLQHDANEKAKERTAALRREVYLRAAEELTKANSYLASLPQVDLTKTNAAEGLQEFFAAAAKLQLVAEPKTALLVNQLVAAYAELLLRLLARLMPLQEVRTNIAVGDHHYNKAQAEITRLLSEMFKYNETAQKNDAVFHALNASLEFHQGQAKKFADECCADRARHNKLHIEFSKSLFAEMKVMGEQQISVLIEIRRDLGLTSELNAFREQMQEQWKRINAQMDLLIDALKDA